jgi:putative oxidoreductase
MKGRQDMTLVLWIVQGLLALAFLLVGFSHAFLPVARLQAMLAWTGSIPVGLLRLIGIIEILGALGLVLPKLTHVFPPLTIAAAIGLVLVMALAVVFHATRKEYRYIGGNLVLLLLATFLVVGCLVWVPVA